MKRGFTLVEVLIATIILAIGLIGSSAFYYANRRNLYTARLERYAMWSAVERMEYIKGCSYSSLSEGETEEEVTIGNLTGERITTIADMDEDGVAFKSVNVRVELDEGGEISLTTYLYNL